MPVAPRAKFVTVAYIGVARIGDAVLEMSDDLLSALPQELQLHIADAVGERCDRASLALASPRLLGLSACRELPSYQGLEMSLAFHHVLGGAIDEQLLRSYASRSKANARKLRRRLEWLMRVTAAAGLQKELRLEVSDTEQRWYLMQPDSTVGALLVLRFTRLPEAGFASHYKGEEGVERQVCFETPDGDVAHYEGEKGAEQMVRFEQIRSGIVSHLEGKKGAERLVRQDIGVRSDLLSSVVIHYEGDKGGERLVRSEIPKPVDSVCYYEGEKGMEHTVCCELRGGGGTWHFEGIKGAERLVRFELPYGGMLHFDGETDAE